jgi:hypothetical protein
MDHIQSAAMGRRLGRTRASSRIRGHVGRALYPMVAAAIAAGQAAAGPDSCAIDAASAICAGDQSLGVVAGQDFDQTNIQNVFVESDTPVSGTSSALRWDISGNNSQQLNSLSASTPTPSVTAASGPAIRITSGGGPGGLGRGVTAITEVNLISNGGTDGAILAQTVGPNGASRDFDGGSGGAGGATSGAEAAVVVSSGATRSVRANGDGNAAVNVIARGGNGGGGANADGILYSAGHGGAGGAGGGASVAAAPGWMFQTSYAAFGGPQANAPAVSISTTGGNGGNGGDSGAASGGNGGAGGAGGDAKFLLNFDVSAGNASISTLGVGGNSPGLRIVSQGGAGGHGGDGDSFGSGGSGGVGGAGGAVSVAAQLSETSVDPANLVIVTEGPTSDGIVAASVGGIGGNGGNGSVFGTSGGSGGNSGSTGAVVIDVTGSISTMGAESYGIFAHSLAGHGGSGGDGRIDFGTEGGSAGNGGPVTVTSSSIVQTHGDGSVGISALSTGGGGGHGGSSFGTFFAGAGTAGNGGAGGAVTIENAGSVTTQGDDAPALYAQSIGGVGGDGGSAGAIVALGGRAGNSSNGGTVVVSNTGALSTGANNASAAATADPTCGTGCSGGIIAQSIGGGGGVSGSTADGGDTGGVIASIGGAAGAGGKGGAVTVTNAAAIATRLATSDVILAQSIGGGGGKGGGSAGFSVVPSVVIGGTGGSGGAAGDVSVAATGSGALSAMGDESRGIVAQSIGGGGGLGGFALDLSVSPLTTAAVTVGGTGGSGGAGGDVTVVTGDESGATAPTISTAGAHAPGIFAQSVGGGGGAGGWTLGVAGTAAAGLPSAAIAVSVGGSGGNAAGGGDVSVTNRAAISTAGDGSTGIYAQSISGGGGDAQFSAAGTVGVASSDGSLNVSLSLGGDGGAGAEAGGLYVENDAAIITVGAFAHGVDAQSVGGDGGGGGVAVSGTLQGNGSVAVAIGGTGGAAGAAGDIYLYNEGAIRVSGDKSMGLSAQSIGGDGGRGAVSITGQVNVTDGKQLGVSLGGAGGSGAPGALVTIDNVGAITTGSSELPDNPQDNAHAIFAQSVGGDGGHGGIAGAFTFGSNQTDEGVQLNAEVAIGGKGAAGATGDTVSVTNSGALTTWAGQSHGIFAQSVGGSGGAGGSGYSGSFQALSDPKSSTYNMAFAMGGTGGSGGDAGEVQVTNSAPIQLNGQAHSTGILAHSVGGGGGSGGSAHTLLWNLIYKTPVVTPSDPDEGMNIGLQVRVGGSGGASGAGNDVDVTNSGSIHTIGSDSIGIHAYSIGGGGGDGGQASGIYVFPIPGTDRTPIYKNVSISVGGNAGAGGDGGDVTVAHSAGDILTEGAGSPGIYAQSVGGGGGMGGTGAAGATGTVAIGGRGGATGDGGAVTVDFSGGSITTLGGEIDSTDPNEAIDSGFGIFAQSVGGGGGHAGNATFFGTPTSTDGSTLGGVTIGIGLGIDLEGGAAGDGGPVSVTADGAISTAGPNASGVFAQSVGGGGGLSGNIGLGGAGTLALGTLLGSSGGNGSAGTVDVEVGGAVSATGDGAQGVFAQSVAPGGSGKVTVTVTGAVRASGTDASGILAQSQKGATFDSHGQPTSTTGGGPVEISLGPGAVVQGGTAGTRSNGAGIQILDGTSNTIAVNGGALLTSVAGHQGWAIETHGGAETVTLDGTMIGSVDLGQGFNNFTIGQSGRWESGATAGLGSTLVVQNGTLSPFGDETIGVTQVNALSWLQAPASGTQPVTVITLDAGKGTADQLRFAQSVGLGGQIDVDTIDVGQGGQAGSVTIMTYPGLASTSGPISVQPSAVANYSLESNPGALVLDYQIDFASDALLGALGRNDRAVASYLKHLHEDGALPRGFGYLLEARDAESYGRELDKLSPIPYAAVPQIVAGTADGLADRLMSCREREGAHRFVTQTSCLWMDGVAQRAERDATDGDPGYSVRSEGLALGGQVDVAEGTQVGFNVAWEPWRADGDNDLWRAASDQFVGGLALKRQIGDTAFALTLGGGFGDVDYHRQGPQGTTATASQSVSFVGATARASHAIVSGNRYLEPRLVLAATQVSAAAVEEAGGGLGRLAVDAVDQTDVILSPQIAVGGEITLSNGALLRPRFLVGLTQYLTDPATDITARLASAPPTDGRFDYVGDADRTRFDFEAGFDLFGRKGLQISARIASQLSANSTAAAASLRASWAF